MAQWMRGADAELTQATVTGGPFPDNVTAWITFLYGPRNPIEVAPGVFTGWVDATTGLRVDYHYGLDLWPLGYGDGSGCPLLALGYGTVSRTLVNDSGFGNFIECKYVVDGHAYRVQYLHMRDAPVLAEGAAVWPGMALGVVGSTGKSSGPHLHMAVYYDDAIQDPLPFLIAAQPAGFVPAAPPAPIDPYPVPLLPALAWRGKGASPWVNVWEGRMTTVRPAINIALIREGRVGNEEVFRLEAEDWIGD